MSRLSILFLAMMTLMAFSASAQCPNPAFTVISSTNETCPGASDGTITLDFGDIPDVAAQNYVYFVINLSTGLTPPNEIESGSSVKFNFLTAGNYSISVVEIAFPPCVTTYNNGGTGIVVGSDDFPTIVPLQTKTICSGENVDLEILLNPANFPAATTFDWLAPIMDDGSVQGSPGVSVPTGLAGDIHITDQLFNTTGAPITATYSVTSTIGTCITGPVDIVITIDPEPVIAPNQTKIICGGENVDYEILLAPLNSPSGTTFDWLAPTMSDGSVQGSAGVGVAADPAGTLHITDILNNMTNNDITARYTVTPANGCSGAPVDIVITVEPTPALIIGQTKIICSGDPVDLEILLNPANTPSGTFFDWPVPMLSAGPAQGTAGTNVPADPAGVPHITDILINTTGAAITATYVVTPLHGGCPGTPENIIITIDPEPVILPNQSGIVCSGTSVSHEILLSPANSPAGVIFDWVLPVMSDGSTQGTIGSAVPADPVGTIHINDAFVNVTGGDITATYTVIATSGICAGQPETIVFTIQPQPAILAGQTETICHNQSVDLEVLLAPLNAPAGTVYDWPLPVMSDGSVQGTVGAGVSADPAGTKHIIDILANLTGAPIFATYTITPTSANGCVGLPEDVVITITPEPVIQLLQTKTICSGGQVNYEILMTPANLPAGTTFDWPVPVMSDGSSQGTAGSGVALGGPGTLHITDILSNSTGAPITATYAVTPSLGTCVGTTTNIIITVNPEPLIVPSQVKTICSGDLVNLEILLAPLNAPASTLFNWSAPLMSDGSSQGSAGLNVSADPAGIPHITDVLTNISGGLLTATYSVIPTSVDGCVGAAEDIIITITPEPVIVTGQAKSICSGDAVNLEILLAPLNSPPGTTFDWLVPVMSDGSTQGSAGTAVSADPAGTLHISDVLINATAGPITATYSIIPSNGSCVGVSENIVITILTDPADVGIVEAPAQTICEGIDQTITLATSEVGVNYEVLIDGSSSGLPIVPGDGSANLVIGTITGLVANTYAVTVTATVGSCMITLTDIVNLVINPIPVVSISGSSVVCENTSSTYSVAAGGTTYVWNLTAGGAISSGQGTNVVTVDWTTGGGDLSVVVTGAAPTNCSDSDLITVAVYGVLPQMADESLDACQNSDQPTLTVGSIAGADVNWYIGSVDAANLVGNGPTYVPRSSVLDMSIPGATIFLVTQTFGCGESPESSYTVTVESGPNAGISGSTSTCIDAAPVDLITVLTGTPDTGGIWTDDNNTGALSNGMFDPSIQGNGAFNFTYTVLGTGVCLGIDSSAVVTVAVASGSDLPTPNQPSYTSCTFGTPPTIGATGTNIQWYADQTLTNLVGSGSSFTPIPGTNIDMTNQGTTSFFATQNEGCGESAGVQINIILIGVTGEINEIENSYPEQDIGTIDVIDITSINTPIEIALFDDNGTQVRDWTQVVEISTGVYGFFFDQLATGTYAIVIEDSNGCTKTLAPAVVGVNTDVFIPNVFTPNGDTYNDLFKILNIQSPAKVQINNRWGVNILTSDDYNNDWDAEGAADGVYYYTVSMGGEVYKGSVEVWRGN